MGKKKPQQSDRTQMIVKLTKRRKDRYEDIADEVDLSLSEWVRRILDAECDRFEAAKREMSGSGPG